MTPLQPPNLPSDEDSETSAEQQYDYFYDIPAHVQAFIEKVQKAIPEGWTCRPWTLNRAVTVFDSRKRAYQVITYEYIEEHKGTYQLPLDL